MKESHDLEKTHYDGHDGFNGSSTTLAPREDELVTQSAFMRKLYSLGVEARGIERVPEDERSPRGIIDTCLMWFSVNAVLTTIPIGILQMYFSQSLASAWGTIVGFTALGCLFVACISILGPLTGMRTMVIARYSGGLAGGFVFAILNIVTQIGFSVTCVILGGNMLNAVSDKIPVVVGVILVAVATLMITFFGIKVVHIWERYAWVLMTAIFVALYVIGCRNGVENVAPEGVTRATVAGQTLSFGGICFGAAVGWAPVAADYNTRLPTNTSSIRVFVYTFLGLFIPLVFTEGLGATLVACSNPAYLTALGEDGSTPALLAEVFSVWGGFGKFLLVLLAFSTVSNNVPNTYSSALSIQALWGPLARVPRVFWTFLVAIIYTVAGVFGRDKLPAILSNLLAILSYWIAFFLAIVIEEHFIFRRRGSALGGYDFAVYNDFSRLPLGIAAIGAMCFGVVGIVLGMQTTWYTGPIGKLIGDFGGDLGFELSLIFAGLTYPIFRSLEIRRFGR
ncbi:hypothetical protein HKX48_002581 [Thoreauomyces humboldtii]|nr:hypothetical protein HKX48_002581 [Thoreauomyces humboldtii]